MAFEDRIRLPALNLIHRRPRLLNLLTQLVEAGQRLITIYAPGGYGKSILLADFAQTTDLPVCWCSLEPTDRDPTSFLTLLVHSITDRFHEIQPEPLFKLVQRGDTQASIRRIADLLVGVGPHLIIIDDYHKAVSAGMSLALNRLLDHLPAASTVIVAARGDMNLETGQILELLISERASGLSEEELRFTGEELQRVMRKRFGRQIDLDTAEEIARSTDGNIAQILMTGHAQSIHAGQLIGYLKQRLGADREVIYSYLAGEVFDKQPPELQHFMLVTSVLPEMTAGFCDELLQINNAQTRLDELVRRDLFIAQIGEGYKYHDLFADFLRSKLAQQNGMYHQVSRRAANLLAARLHFEEAVNLYLAVQAWDEAAAILETQGRFFYDTGRALTLNHWLVQMPDPELAQHPRLLLLRGQIFNYDLGDPEQAITLFQRAEAQFLKRDDLIGAAEAQIWQSVGLRMMGRANESLQLVSKGVDQLAALQADNQVIAWAVKNRGFTQAVVGNMSEALLDTRRALELYEALGDIYGVGVCHHEIGVCLVSQGNIKGAEHHYRQALRSWESLGNAYDLANTLNSLGVSLLALGHYDEALKQFRESLDVALQIGAARRAAFARAGMGDVYLECQKYKQALKEYDLSTRFAQEAAVRSLEVYNLVKVGECYYQQHDLTRAFNLAGQAREIAAETGLVFEHGLACALQAKIYVSRAEYKASFNLFATALAGLAGNDVLEQTKVRFWWSYASLCDARSTAALEQLQEALRLALDLGHLKQGLTSTLVEIRQLLLHFLHRDDTPAQVRESIYGLLEQTRAKIELTQPSLQVFAFGMPLLIVAGARRRFTQRGGMHKTPEFLLYLLIEGQEGGCRWSDVSAAIWPDLEPERASTIFHQTLKRLRDVIFEAPDYIIRRDDYYAVNRDYLEWSDAQAFENLFDRAAKATPEEALPLQLELIGLYQGEFLAGFELGEWGTAYRASCETRFLQVVTLASEQLLQVGSPQEALTVLNKGLTVDYFREDLHRAALRAYADLGLHDHLAAHYRRLCAIFKEELDAFPEPETQQLYQELMTTRSIRVLTPT